MPFILISLRCSVEMIRKAKQLGLFTTPYVFNVEGEQSASKHILEGNPNLHSKYTEAKLMASAGADVIVAHMG